MPDELGRPCMQHDPIPCGPHYSPIFQPDVRDGADLTPPPVPALPRDVWDAAEQAEMDADAYTVDPREAMASVAYAAGVAAGRTAAAAAADRRDLRDLAERMHQRADDGDNPYDCGAMQEFADELIQIARIAEGKPDDRS